MAFRFAAEHGRRIAELIVQMEQSARDDGTVVEINVTQTPAKFSLLADVW